jgi:hypothetical protein
VVGREYDFQKVLKYRFLKSSKSLVPVNKVDLNLPEDGLWVEPSTGATRNFRKEKILKL